jgi:hypothetical protein
MNGTLCTSRDQVWPDVTALYFVVCDRSSRLSKSSCSDWLIKVTCHYIMSTIVET